LRLFAQGKYLCGHGLHGFESCAKTCHNLYASNACITYCGHAIGGPPPSPSSSLTAPPPPYGRQDILTFWSHCPMLRKIT
jgi:hypothetical protein